MQKNNNWKLSETRKWFVGKWIFYDCYHGNYTVYDWYQNMTKYDFFWVLFDTEIEYHDFFKIAMACGATIKEDLYVNIENFAMKTSRNEEKLSLLW